MAKIGYAVWMIVKKILGLKNSIYCPCCGGRVTGAQREKVLQEMILERLMERLTEIQKGDNEVLRVLKELDSVEQGLPDKSVYSQIREVENAS